MASGGGQGRSSRSLTRSGIDSKARFPTFLRRFIDMPMTLKMFARCHPDPERSIPVPGPAIQMLPRSLAAKIAAFWLLLALILSSLTLVAAPPVNSPFQPLSGAELTKSVRIVQKRFASQGLPSDGLLFPGV